MRAALIVMTLFACAPAVSAGDSLVVKHHCVSFNPIGVLTGTFVANYELMVGRHGFLVEGGYAIPLLQEYAGGAAAYRFRFTKSALGHFIGPFIRTGKLSQKIPLERGEPPYKYTLSYTSAGFNWGWRRSLWKKHGLLFTYRLGAGYPFKLSLTWDRQPPETLNGISFATFEKLYKLGAYLDGELTVSFAF